MDFPPIFTPAILFFGGSGSTCPATYVSEVSDFFFQTNRGIFQIKQNLPARSRKKVEAPILIVVNGLPWFGMERVPSLAGVSTLDHQPTPAASEHVLSTKAIALRMTDKRMKNS
jgi:hypothetical protein